MKRIIVTMLILSLFVSFSTFATPIKADTMVYGDVYNDGIVNGKDILALRKHVAGKTVANINLSVADVDGDGELKMSDVLKIRQYVAGIVKSLRPWSENY